MPTFHDFAVRPSSLKALTSMQIEVPTPIQESSIPVLLEGHDVIAQAFTGSGKTLAFGIPLMEKIET